MTIFANPDCLIPVRWILCPLLTLACLSPAFAQEQPESLTAEELQLVRDVEEARIRVVEKVVGSVIAIYGPSRQGGGSGVIIDPSGIALTNHHVIEGAGLHGFGGLDDGELYEWDLIGTDPGGDVAIIKMKGKDQFPFSPLGDSDKVKVGDWALAMGNPFLLAHDPVPHITLGVVSGVERFPEG
ncbi:MAG: S1C family serine protease, partial [Pirellulaceae bacterium]